MADRFRCIHCNGYYPRERASQQPYTWDDLLPIGVCDQEKCREDHEACRNQKPGWRPSSRWRELPRVYWGTCLDCKGAVWQLRPGTRKGSWHWRCAKCGMSWPEQPHADEVQQE